MTNSTSAISADDFQLNQGCDYRERLGPAADGQEVLDYLARRYRHSSAAEWAARIADGCVLIDGRLAVAGQILRRGGELLWRRPPWQEPTVSAPLCVLYEDEDLLAVAKPPGLPTLPGAGFLQSTLLHQVQRYASEAAPLHRLGRWTSGIVLCARSHHARAELTRQWSCRETVKRYRALARGRPDFDDLTIVAPIGLVPHALLGLLHAAAPGGKPSVSRMTVLERRADESLCDVVIATGRPHQIRIHLAAAGHPLVGDPLYEAGGGPAPGSRALPGDPGYHLHAAELRFRHPRSGGQVVVECPPPARLRTATEGN